MSRRTSTRSSSPTSSIRSSPMRPGNPSTWSIRRSCPAPSETALAPEVMSCVLMTGDADYNLRVVVRDLNVYRLFLTRALGPLKRPPLWNSPLR
ncbi:Lrp/AsnC ligand binding domain-containing protein [Paraburkholderia sediminicola]|uniref:Lrp/AsnC ligand binding domain-containing protein n=1 Tax=Paraburkholderia sediminicola TaxID=458836 RepID=UPI0038BDE945